MSPVSLSRAEEEEASTSESIARWVSSLPPSFREEMRERCGRLSRAREDVFCSQALECRGCENVPPCVAWGVERLAALRRESVLVDVFVRGTTSKSRACAPHSLPLDTFYTGGRRHRESLRKRLGVETPSFDPLLKWSGVQKLLSSAEDCLLNAVFRCSRDSLRKIVFQIPSLSTRGHANLLLIDLSRRPRLYVMDPQTFPLSSATLLRPIWKSVCSKTGIPFHSPVPVGTGIQKLFSKVAFRRGKEGTQFRIDPFPLCHVICMWTLSLFLIAGDSDFPAFERRLFDSTFLRLRTSPSSVFDELDSFVLSARTRIDSGRVFSSMATALERDVHLLRSALLRMDPDSAFYRSSHFSIEVHSLCSPSSSSHSRHIPIFPI